jgi:hypothetical protein
VSTYKTAKQRDNLAFLEQTKAEAEIKYKQAQHAYLCGVGLILGEDMPVLLSLCLNAGRDITSIIERTQPR